LLLETFLSVGKTDRPVVVLNDQLVISNAPAARLLSELGQSSLWNHAAAAIGKQQPRRTELTLPSGRVVAIRCLPVADGPDVIGALVEIQPPDRAPAFPATLVSPVPGRIPESSSRIWQQLRERGVALRDAGLPLLVAGEPGAGKLTLAADLFPEACQRGLMIVHDAARQPVEGASAWISRLTSSLSRPEGVVVVRGVQSLDISAVGALCSLVDDLAPRAPYFVTTANLDQVKDVHQPLVDRLSAGKIHVPALRERIDDLPFLLTMLTERHAGGPGRLRWRRDATQALSRFDWPGNVRQLESMVRRLVATCDHRDVLPGDLPEEIRAQATGRRLSQLERVEMQAIIDALRRSEGNKSEAAEFLGISRATLYRKLKAFRIDTAESVCLAGGPRPGGWHAHRLSARWSALRHASACAVSEGLCPAEVGNTDGPST
jgi:hypothetical protein